MTKPLILTVVFATAIFASGGKNSIPARPPITEKRSGEKGTISVQEMLVLGTSGLKLHSLSMISQGNIKGDVNESYLPGLKDCSNDRSLPIRSITAQILGKYFVQGKKPPNAEAVGLLIKLAKDPSRDVRYNAAYYGLTQIENKSDEIVALLIDIASSNREQNLSEHIAQSLESNQENAARIMDKMLATEDNVAIFEIYENLTGRKPTSADKYLDMPSSRTRMFVFGKTSDEAEQAKSELEKELKAVGITAPSVQTSGTGESYVLMVKTYITKEGMAVEKNFSGKGKFKIIQQMWLSPEHEIQLKAMQKTQH
ncbi:HEAT repeat domain-containing protein [Pontiella sulfatireligans]|uniref:Uncharacterized protein n=1 Tax=Pontiella sulfatireligans TaxID=2750658 RepID=A0A6C2UMR8_9BACT|nr:HEAT repeat domain-containing protein [Pontiella sulfatireligans]VGO21233.1 hypothetical protein SCARR_03305 [Pontiella sulfatireligans]